MCCIFSRADFGQDYVEEFVKSSRETMVTSKRLNMYKATWKTIYYRPERSDSQRGAIWERTWVADFEWLFAGKVTIWLEKSSQEKVSRWYHDLGDETGRHGWKQLRNTALEQCFPTSGPRSCLRRAVKHFKLLQLSGICLKYFWKISQFCID